MSTVLDQDGEVDWKALIDSLRDGKTTEIPCAKERDYVRRENQIVKRAEKKGIAVTIHRGEGVLRVEPQPGTGGDVAVSESGEAEFRGDRQQERQQRREAVRAMRQAERGQES